MKRRIKLPGTDGVSSVSQSSALLLLDTSWRVALPILVLSLLGHYLDVRTNHVILFSLIGLFLSLAIATMLVYRQLCVAFPDQFGKNKKVNK